jgi:hypothetical protein
MCDVVRAYNRAKQESPKREASIGNMLACQVPITLHGYVSFGTLVTTW